MANYYEIDALSASALARLAVSPATLRAWQSAQHERTDDMRLGAALHATRDGSFDQTFTVRPAELDGKGPGGRTKVTAWNAEQAALGREVLSADDHATAIAMSKAIDPLVRDLERGCAREVELFWKRDDTDCKAKLDVISPLGVVLDYKKTSKGADASSFSKTIASYRMHIQAAWYLEACRENNIPADIFAWVVVEDKEPHLTAIYQASDADWCDSAGVWHEAMLPRARAEIDALVTLYRQCKQQNNWPGLSHRPQLISLPRWYRGRE